MKKIIIFMACLAISDLAICQTNSQIVQNTNTLAQAKQKGETEAQGDIAKGTMQILYYGKPWSMGKALVDDETQLPVKIVAGCCVLPECVAETDAYNAVMRKAADTVATKFAQLCDSFRAPGNGFPDRLAQLIPKGTPVSRFKTLLSLANKVERKNESTIYTFDRGGALHGGQGLMVFVYVDTSTQKITSVVWGVAGE